ncbi:Subtilase family protein [Fibrobacter sp. UWT2]|jgi:hypothetical protein|uniref:S8 family serine peptidase n=1 Tax=Fibrobacter sp. UWT2 TaxID=1896224 RepID=UPI000917C759|nr:S8 family serine peptidase [Fibrobacter sp. UWT2]SHL35547.1 Subtilase family protein [Fibrobacter sp. UWT2]
MNSTKIIAAAVMACSIASQAQLLEKYEMPAKKSQSLAASETIDRMDPEVRKFVNNRKTKKVLRQKVVKSDLLGRKGASKSASVKDSVVYVTNSADTEKMRVIVSRISKDPFVDIDGYTDEVYYDENRKQLVYSFNGKQMSASEYKAAKDKWQKKYDRAAKKISAPVIKNLTAAEIEQEYNSSDEVYVSSMPNFVQDEIVGLTDGHYAATADVMWGINGLKTSGFDAGYKGQNIGVYFSEPGCADRGTLGSYYQELYCSGRGNGHAAKVGKLLNSTAPSAKLYGQDANSNVYLSNPSSKNIMIGSHSWHYARVYDRFYTVDDADMDQDAYSNRITHFVAAGNKVSEPDYYILTPGRSINAITVGAVYPTKEAYGVNNGYLMTEYTFHINPDINHHGDGNAKPEVLNFTNFKLSDGILFGGTSASTPFTAGMAAVLMSQRAEFQKSPEKVKAVMLAAEGIQTLNAEDIDYDDAKFTAQIPSYKLMNKAYIKGWPGKTEQQIFGSNNHGNDAYTTVTRTVQKGKRYRAAIAWMEPAYYITTNKQLAYDFDLAVFGTPVGTRGYQSQSLFNNFEVLDFVPKQSGDVQFRIVNYRNEVPSKPIYLAFSFVQVD